MEEQKKSDSGVRGRQAGRGTVALYYDRDKDEEIPKTREELVSLAVLRQAESYEHLGNRKEALVRYKEYVEKYPKGKYLIQAKEKIAQIER